MARKRKPTVEYQIVCSGKGKPWHQSRTHRHIIKKLEKAIESRGRNNDGLQATPLKDECQPWVLQTREISQWETYVE